MVKLEGAGPMIEVIAGLSARDVSVCAHLGLTPQSLHKLGGFKVQGRDQKARARLLADAKSVQAAGADLLVLECVPSDVAAEITSALTIPTIGIGAGVQCDGQVLVVFDALGIGFGRRPRFVHNFLEDLGNNGGTVSVLAGVQNYVKAVKAKTFPGPEHVY